MTSKESRDREQFWRRVLEERPRSGMTVNAFCSKSGVSVPSYYAWRRRIQASDSQPSDSAIAPGEASLVPVTVVDSVIENADAVAADRIEIVTPNGFIIRMNRCIEANSIAQLLRVIESLDGGANSC